MLNINTLREYNIIEDITNSTSEGINVVDIQGNVVFSNKISAEYAGVKPEDMVGKKVTKFYPDAVLLQVLKTRKPTLDRKIHYIGDKKYIVNAYPIVINGEIVGAFSVFRDIREIDELNRKIQALQLHLSLSDTEDDISSLIGVRESLSTVLQRAKRTIGSIGGPRHSIIIGDSGTGKTMLARLIYNYGMEIGTLDSNAPFIEVNCAQFTNSDIAALEIFGSEEGSFTGAREKKGLLERANGGILFLDEAHQLGNYQSILLTAVETGRFRRIGGNKEISVDVIIIAASTKNLKNELLPELYQRLAQYELYLPPLNERSEKEKLELFNYFIRKYEEAVHEYQGIKYEVNFTDEAKKLLLEGEYPRNIRQFRDVINFSIDQASPLIADLKDKKEIKVKVRPSHLPFEISKEKYEVDKFEIIKKLRNKGLGPRKISKELESYGINYEYYKVAYYLKKLEK